MAITWQIMRNSNNKRGAKLNSTQADSIVSLINHVCIMVLAYAVSHSKCYLEWLDGHRTLRNKSCLALIFGLFSLYAAAAGGVANVRVLGPMLGGLIGGPAVGICAGIFGGIYRFLDLRYAGASEMSLSALLATILAGLSGGLIYRWQKGQLTGVWITAMFAVGFEVFHMALTIAMGYQNEIVIKTVENVAIPMIISHAVGATLFVFITKNIMSARNLEKELLHFDRLNLVGQMAANVAHEIRNPLTSVRGYLQRMQMKNNYNLSKEHCNLMLEELDRTNQIISEYLLLTKEKVSYRENCCLNSLIKTLYPLLDTNALSVNSTITLALETVPTLCLDEKEIRQLLLNLVNNGLEAMPLGGNIVIRTFLAHSTVVLSVSDQGLGIPTKLIDKLGTPFLTTKSEGTGLGLAICYRIAFRHNASIKAETSSTGTTFSVNFALPVN
ncbi:LytS/YhcK type 5TM receptor domain-containing protein [Anaerospora hongkongensis]|uniref:LytS/YhcK type 5TM receptor domain-containing protein n=1 Tax=Anaerospora hongkongensis TaxID=244830 RepID=UPI00289651C0|nr:LytS/YhcK type 5TM receptor domain-containing protein [Anaerospora hongkongensis]